MTSQTSPVLPSPICCPKPPMGRFAPPYPQRRRNFKSSPRKLWIESRPMSPAGPTIEVVHDADERTQGAICVAIDESGRTVGTGSVRKEVPQPLGRPVWVYESDLGENSDDLGQRMFLAAFDALEAEFKANRDGPRGLCRLVTDDVEMAKRPEAIWPEEGLIFAGYVAEGSQVRIRWFWDATAEPGLPNSLTLDQSLA